MSGQEYAPGTIARATVPSGLAPRDNRGSDSASVLVTRSEGIWIDATDYNYAYIDEEVTDVRPLVVLDLPNGALAGWPVLIDALRRAKVTTGYELVFGGLIKQIEAQTKPPKPPEPEGLYAVVETSDGRKWFHARPQGLWHMTNDVNGNTAHQAYARLDVVRVLSEGVTP